MIVAIVGSRERNSPKDKAIIEKAIERMQLYGISISMIITGGTQRGPEQFAKEIAEELGIPYKEFCPWNDVFKLDQPRTRQKEIEARDIRRQVVAMHADYMLCLIDPKGKHGEILSAGFFMQYHNEFQRYKNLELL